MEGKKERERLRKKGKETHCHALLGRIPPVKNQFPPIRKTEGEWIVFEREIAESLNLEN